MNTSRQPFKAMHPFLGISTLLIFCFLFSCSENPPKDAASTDHHETSIIKSKPMNSYVSLFEIPATDITRAISFYQAILGIAIEKMEMPGMEMGIFPYEEQVTTGVIMKGEGYVPHADGVTIYLDAGDDLERILDRVEQNGGTVIVPKTAHADESGYFALFLDSEGNKMGLNSTR